MGGLPGILPAWVVSFLGCNCQERGAPRVAVPVLLLGRRETWAGLNGVKFFWVPEFSHGFFTLELEGPTGGSSSSTFGVFPEKPQPLLDLPPQLCCPCCSALHPFDSSSPSFPSLFPIPPSHPSFPPLIPSQHRGSGTPDPPKTRTAVQPWAGQECGIPFPPCPRCQIPLRAQPVPGLVSGGFPTIPAALGCGCHGNPTSPAPSLLLRGSSCIPREMLPCSPSHFWHRFTSRLLQTRHCRAG